MNYAEELVYWYLRFNGFLPLMNFVLHRGPQIKHTSDCDVLAIRHPHAFEYIGGKESDRDQSLAETLNFDRILGVICEVKSGQIDTVLQQANVEYAVRRLGLVENPQPVIDRLVNHAIWETQEFQIAKLLISDKVPRETDSYLHLSLKHTTDFIVNRVWTYDEKFRDRHFFKSNQLQQIIYGVELNRRKRSDKIEFKLDDFGGDYEEL